MKKYRPSGGAWSKFLGAQKCFTSIIVSLGGPLGNVDRLGKSTFSTVDLEKESPFKVNLSG